MRFIILLFLSFPLMAYDQFEGYDLSNPYPSTNEDYYRIQDERRYDRERIEDQIRYDEQNNFNPHNPHNRFEIDWD